MALEKLMEPGYIGKVKIKNRTSMSPMEKQWADRFGNPTQIYINYLVERAKHGVGMITSEANFIDPKGRGNMWQVGLWDDSNIPAHQRLTEAVHKYGCYPIPELHHAGRNANTTKTGFQPVAPSPIPCMISGGSLPRELSIDEIKEIQQRFADGARRAKQAGYKIICLHGAHGYLLNAFLSPYSNKRNDAYGGDAEKRMRFGLETVELVKKTVGPDFPVGYRITADDFVEGGLQLEETQAFVKKLEDVGLDYIDVSAGIYESAEMVIQPMDIAIGCLVPFAAGMKEAVDIPVITAGRINDMTFAERILENNEADFVHMGRAFHADPEILEKSLRGDMDDICMCMACNKCIDLMFENKRVHCTVNPAACREREMEIKPARDKKKVMVVGGGVAGMEAARIAALRGHNVTLFEKESELGGHIRWASKGQFREEFWQTARYRINAAEKAGVEVKLGQEVRIDDVKTFNPDVLVVATGTVPFIPPYIPGVDKPLVTNYQDVLLGKKPVGKKAVVYGAQDKGIIVAEFLSQHGCQVVLVGDTGAIAQDRGGISQMVTIPRTEADPNIEIKLNNNIEEIGDDWVEIQSNGERERINGLDMVVFAWHREMVRQLHDDVLWADAVDETYIIGDASWPRHAIDAIYEGAVTGRKI